MKKVAAFLIAISTTLSVFGQYKPNAYSTNNQADADAYMRNTLTAGTNNYSRPNNFTSISVQPTNYSGNILLTNNLDSGYFSMVHVIQYNTNGLIPSGFDQAGFNHQFNWNPNQPYVDDNSISLVGCYTNAFGYYIMYDLSSNIYAGSTTTNLVPFDFLYYSGTGQNPTGSWQVNDGITAGTVSYLPSATNLDVKNSYADTSGSSTNAINSVNSTNGYLAISPSVSPRQNFGSKSPTIFFSLSPTANIPSQANIISVISWLNQTAGMRDIVSGIMCDDLWYNSANYSTITNGWTTTYTHTNGLLFGLWSSLLVPGGAGSPVAFSEGYPTNYYHAFSNFIGSPMFVDEIKLDNSLDSAEPSQRQEVEKLKIFGQTYAASIGRSVAFSIKAWQGNTSHGYFDEPYSNYKFLPFMAGFTHWDLSGGSWGSDNFTWTNFVQNVYANYGSLTYAGNGNYPFYPELEHFNHNTNNLIGALTMLTVMPERFFITLTNWNASDLIVLTNKDWLTIYKDQNRGCAYQVFSNTAGNNDQIYVANLGNGDKAVAILNPLNAGTISNTFSSTLIGIPTNTYLLWHDIWHQSADFITNQGFTATVVSNSAAFYRVSVATNTINHVAGEGSGLTGVTASSVNTSGTNTFTMGGTGYTNVNAFDVRIFELQGTSLVFTNLTSGFGFSLGTLSVNNDFMILHTNECVIGTGVTGKILQ